MALGKGRLRRFRWDRLVEHGASALRHRVHGRLLSFPSRWQLSFWPWHRSQALRRIPTGSVDPGYSN